MAIRRTGTIAVFVAMLGAQVYSLTPAAAAEECTVLHELHENGDEPSGVDVAEQEVTPFDPAANEDWSGGKATIVARKLSAPVHTRIVRSVVMVRAAGAIDFIEWGWLRDAQGSANIEFFWARKLAGAYRDDRSTVYSYSTRTAKIESQGPTFIDSSIHWKMYVGSTYKGQVEHQFNQGPMFTIAERWNSCDPNEAKFESLEYRDGGTYFGWREMAGLPTPTGVGHDPGYQCEKGMSDGTWWTEKVAEGSTPADCFPDLDGL